jgi:hypothetical protein
MKIHSVKIAGEEAIQLYEIRIGFEAKKKACSTFAEHAFFDLKPVKNSLF